MDVLSFNTISDHIKKEINHKCDLNLSQTRILLFFDSTNNESLTMGDLAKKLNISLSTLSRQLQQKKTQSFIEITRSNKDSSKNIKLNGLGLKKTLELKNSLNEIRTMLFSSINSNTELHSFIYELNKMAKRYSNDY